MWRPPIFTVRPRFAYFVASTASIKVLPKHFGWIRSAHGRRPIREVGRCPILKSKSGPTFGILPMTWHALGRMGFAQRMARRHTPNFAVDATKEANRGRTEKIGGLHIFVVEFDHPIVLSARSLVWGFWRSSPSLVGMAMCWSTVMSNWRKSDNS